MARLHALLSGGERPRQLQLLMGNRVISEPQCKRRAELLQGEFKTGQLNSDIYKLRATGEAGPEMRAAQRQFILAPIPFDW